MRELFEIKSDCLDIVKRLKAIDKSYFVVRNLSKNTFELHSHNQLKKTYCLTIPYDTLDERTIDLALKTRVCNSDEIFKMIDEHNARREKMVVKQVLDDFKEKLYDS